MWWNVLSNLATMFTGVALWETGRRLGRVRRLEHAITYGTERTADTMRRERIAELERQLERLKREQAAEIAALRGEASP